MIATAATPNVDRSAGVTSRTIWGLKPVQVHDRYWASRGVQVTRHGGNVEPVADAELFLLLDHHSHLVFDLGQVINTLSWVKPELMCLRVRDEGRYQLREWLQTDPQGEFVRFSRSYDASASSQARIGLTPNPHLARLWQAAPSPCHARRLLRDMVDPKHRMTVTVRGAVYDGSINAELDELMKHLVRVWKRPDMTIGTATRESGLCWVDKLTGPKERVRTIGPVWIGAGRTVPAGELVPGPAVLWDTPQARPEVKALDWQEIELLQAPVNETSDLQPRVMGRSRDTAKRAFDVAFAIVALLVTLPLYPIIALAIVIEDGWPVFFAQKRQTRGGQNFPCLKFRSMKRDAELVKLLLGKKNQADGPQFFLDNDPRLTRVGRFLRKVNLDELPQFINVLLGHMSVVGPRPLPYKENQYSPIWRETRLSMRPGITGLWQIKRTRKAGLDFQEWIRFDMEYAARKSWKLDLWIIWRTLFLIVRG